MSCPHSTSQDLLHPWPPWVLTYLHAVFLSCGGDDIDTPFRASVMQWSFSLNALIGHQPQHCLRHTAKETSLAKIENSTKHKYFEVSLKTCPVSKTIGVHSLTWAYEPPRCGLLTLFIALDINSLLRSRPQVISEGCSVPHNLHSTLHKWPHLINWNCSI